MGIFLQKFCRFDDSLSVSQGCIFEADASFGAIILPGGVLGTFSKPSLFGRCVDNCSPLDPAVGATQCCP